MQKSFWEMFRAWFVGIPIFLAIVISIAVVSPSFQACYHEKYAEHAGSKQLEKYQSVFIITVRCSGTFIDVNHDGITAIATVFIALFTVTLWWAAAGQYDLIEQQIKLARSEYISSNRPRIVLKEVWMDQDKGEILYILVNTGGSPATIIESWIFAEWTWPQRAIRPLRSQGYDYLGRLTFAAGEMKDLIFPIPAGVATFVRVPEIKRIATEDRPAMTDWKLYFIGVILYSDEIGNKRRSVFRRQWNEELSGFERLKDPDQEYAD
jgi:hypothetical protein